MLGNKDAHQRETITNQYNGTHFLFLCPCTSWLKAEPNGLDTVVAAEYVLISIVFS